MLTPNEEKVEDIVKGYKKNSGSYMDDVLHDVANLKEERLEIFKANLESVCKKILDENFFNKNKDKAAALSCILGAFLGDAYGGFCEFSHPSLEDKKNSKKVFAKGRRTVFGESKGHVTDDSEMAMSMAYAIMDMKDPKEIDPNLDFFYYGIWLKTNPKDIGNTTRMGLNYFSINSRKTIDIAKIKFDGKANKKMNETSLSNGFLMRISTFVAWYFYAYKKEVKKGLSFEEKPTKDTLFLIYSISEQVYLDNVSTHFSKEVKYASALFVFMALCAICENKPKIIIKKIKNVLEPFADHLKKHVKKDDLQGYIEIKKKIQEKIYYFEKYDISFIKKNYFPSIGTRQIGYYLHGFSLTLFYLFFYDQYENMDKQSKKIPMTIKNSEHSEEKYIIRTSPVENKQSLNQQTSQKQQDANPMEIKNQPVKPIDHKEQDANSMEMKNQPVKPIDQKEQDANSMEIKDPTATSTDQNQQAGKPKETKDQPTTSINKKEPAEKPNEIKNQPTKSIPQKEPTEKPKENKDQTATSINKKEPAEKPKEIKNQSAKSIPQKEPAEKPKEIKDQTAQSIYQSSMSLDQTAQSIYQSSISTEIEQKEPTGKPIKQNKEITKSIIPNKEIVNPTEQNKSKTTVKQQSIVDNNQITKNNQNEIPLTEENGTYKKIMLEICDIGGDTDTNAAIVGTVIGPVVGLRNFPKDDLTVLVEFCDKTRYIYSTGLMYYFVEYLESIEKKKAEKNIRFNFFKMIELLKREKRESIFKDDESTQKK